MPIQLEEERQPGLPVVKRTALGQVFNGAIVRVEQRNRQKRDDATKALTNVINPRTGKPSQELVVTCLTLPGTTSPVGLGDDEHTPETEELVRLILKGKGFGDWIESKGELGRPINVGDIVIQKTTFAQVYNQDGEATGKEITDQATLNAVPRGKSVGVYGTLEVRAPKDGSDWTVKAEDAYHATKPSIPAETGVAAATSAAGGYDTPPEEPPYFDDSEPPF